MGIYTELYDFAASAGSFEGYVYHRDHFDVSYLPKWSENLLRQYQALPDDVKEQIQHMCDATLGRAVLSIVPRLGDEHEVVLTLKQMIKGKMPESPDDFDKH